MTIRRPQQSELPLLQAIEVAAGAVFAEFGMKAIAEDDPPSLETLKRFSDAGRAWVHADKDDVPRAYVICEVVDGCAHIEQVSVDPDFARHGLGKALIEHTADWARSERLEAITLTTFDEVPWNRPYYERCGFRVLSELEMTAGLTRIRTEESKQGLDEWPRVCMRREL